MTLLAGLHDREGAHLVPAGGWCLDTVALGEAPAPPNYGALAPDIHWIVRLNWGYGSTGTLPPGGSFAAFAKRCATYVQASRGCTRWIIGNEPNLPREWPNGQPISPQLYAEFYQACRAAIRAVPGHQHDEVLIAAPGPWNAEYKYPGNETGDWITYYRHVLARVDADGVALHAYTHGYDPALVKSTATMDAPFTNRFYHFRTYMDYLGVTPGHYAVYITEANGDGPWQATGLIPAMLREVADWNALAASPVRAVIFYRYPDYDSYGMASKPDVIREFQQAAPNYAGPGVTAQAQPAPAHTVNIPSIPNAQAGTTSQPPKRIWDGRLSDRGVSIQTPATTGPLWRVVMGRWEPESEAGGRHHIYVDALDEHGARVPGVPLLVNWPGGNARIFTEAKPGEPFSGNFPMTASRNEFSIRVDDGTPSELVTGIGMGAMTPGGFNAGIHTNTILHFQRAAQQAAPAPDPVPPTPPEPAPGSSDTQVPVPPTPGGDHWPRVRAFVRQWEGGFQDHDWDIGNWTGCAVGKGEKKGTNFGISACSYPHLDIRNLTMQQADDIYFRDYWQASGADTLPWPLCLLVFDTAVNFHPATAKKWLAESNANPLHFVALRLRGYRKSKAWPQAGNAWVDRVIDLALEASK